MINKNKKKKIATVFWTYTAKEKDSESSQNCGASKSTFRGKHYFQMNSHKHNVLYAKSKLNKTNKKISLQLRINIIEYWNYNKKKTNREQM